MMSTPVSWSCCHLPRRLGWKTWLENPEQNLRDAREAKLHRSQSRNLMEPAIFPIFFAEVNMKEQME